MPLISTLANASARGYGMFGGAAALPTTGFVSIATVTVGTAQSTITFSSIPQVYKHLQIRFMNPAGATSGDISAQFNGDTGGNYRRHYLGGDGGGSTFSGASGASSTNVSIGYGANTSGTYPSVGIVDILDYTNTNKYKVTRALTGQDVNGTGGYNFYFSGLWINTSAITSISIFNSGSNNFVTNTKVALYGIQG